jgi:hypothetical protein
MYNQGTVYIAIIGTFIFLLQTREAVFSAFVRIFSTDTVSKCLQKNQKYTDIQDDYEPV